MAGVSPSKLLYRNGSRRNYWKLVNEAGEGAGDIIGVSGTGAKAGTRGSLRLLSDLTSLISAFGNFGKIFQSTGLLV